MSWDFMFHYVLSLKYCYEACIFKEHLGVCDLAICLFILQFIISLDKLGNWSMESETLFEMYPFNDNCGLSIDRILESKLQLSIWKY